MSNRIQLSALLLVLALNFALATGNTNTRAAQVGCLVSTSNGDVQGRDDGKRQNHPLHSSRRFRQ
jgi:hypothetical protein